MSHSHRIPSATLDDDAIGQLAAEPQRPLFPLLAHAEAMVPLVMVLAFLPPLYAVRHRTLTEAGAREAVLSLRCLSATSLAEFIDPARLDPLNPLRYQPPLMNWLTALSVRFLGNGSATGIVAPAYLCTAGLIVAVYVLARRLGGEPLGLVAAALLAFNPQILEGAQEPLPQSLTGLLAVLALAGTVAHWQKSSNVASYQLLLGGLSLGLCLLAGGPVALAVVVVLVVYSAWWRFMAGVQAWRGTPGERSPIHLHPALHPVAVLAATAFAVGGWHLLLMSSQYGSNFWNDWWRGGAASGFDGGPSARHSWIMDAIWELDRPALPLFGLSLVGLVGILRDWYRSDDDSARRYRGLLVVWIAAALTGWMLSGGPAGADAPGGRAWDTLLAIPLVIAAALGLIDIAERRVGFFLSLAFGLLAIGGAAVSAGQFLTGEPGEESVLVFSGWHVSLRSLSILAVLAAAGAVLARLPRGRDGRQRAVLAGMLAVIVAAHCVWGILAVRRTSAGDHELEELRAGLARLPATRQCTFVALTSAEASPLPHPPPQLVAVAALLWPDAAINFSSSWDDAGAGESVAEADEAATAVFVTWSPRGRPRRVAPAPDLKAAAPPFHYGDLEVVAYTRDR
jgi:hypothetical protein